MRYFCDTHILLWALEDDAKLPVKAKEIILDDKSEIFYSFVNVWEVAIKYALQKDDFKYSPEEFVNFCDEAGYVSFETSFEHAYALKTLRYDIDAAPERHNDPFDRLLIAQAKVEEMKFITHDRLIPFYHEPCVVSV